MTRRDWESIRVQVETGMAFRALDGWLASIREKLVKEIAISKQGEAERQIGALAALMPLTSQFKSFVDMQINNSTQEEDNE